MKLLVSAIACLGLASITVAQQPRWREEPPKRFLNTGLRMEGARKDPHPYWVSIRWQPAVEKYFTVINDELEFSKPVEPDSDKRGVWQKQTVTAYKAWFDDHQNPERLYRVAICLLIGGYVDEGFARSGQYQEMFDRVDLGFSLLRPENVPPSYWFARAAYIFNAGDGHMHYYKDLARRLLERTPSDRAVTIAMVREYGQRGKDPAFEKLLFDSLFDLAKTTKWKYWDDAWIARAMRMSGIYNQSKSYFDKGIAYLDKAIAKTPNGKDPKPLIEERKRYLRERDAPNFGQPVFEKKSG